jgi:hypothetical protein
MDGAGLPEFTIDFWIFAMETLLAKIDIIFCTTVRCLS